MISPHDPGSTSRARSALVLVAGSLTFVALAWPALVADSLTYDECAHLAGGYSYITRHDYRMNPEHPVLGKSFAALPLLAMDIRWPEKDPDWESGNEWGFGYAFLYDSGNNAEQVLAVARLGALFWSLLLLGSVYAVARELCGPRGALVSFVLMAFCPTLIAHSHYVTTDAIAACLMFLSVAAYRGFFRSLSLRWAVYSGILTGGAMAAKYSSVLLLPTLGLLALVHIARGSRRPDPLPAKSFAPPWPSWLRAGVLLVLMGILSLGVIWAAYGFRYATSPDASYGLEQEAPEADAGLFKTLTAAAQKNHFLPEAFLDGQLNVYEHSKYGHTAYLLGRHSTLGWKWYFPYAFLVKTPLAALLLMGWGIGTWMRKPDAARDGEGVYLLIPCVVYGGASILSSINIGVRHLLPLMPFLSVAAGAVLSRTGTEGRRRVLAVVTLLAAATAGCLFQAPNLLGYFNEVALLVNERHEMLIDSNLDWGQDLGRLKTYMDRNGIARVKLAYMGTASPKHYGIAHEVLPADHLYAQREPEWVDAKDIGPGDWVAVSVNPYVGLRLENPSFYQDLLSGVPRVATIGRSIFLFQVPPGAARRPVVRASDGDAPR
jgi:hypothetical protein